MKKNNLFLAGIIISTIGIVFVIGTFIISYKPKLQPLNIQPLTKNNSYIKKIEPEKIGIITENATTKIISSHNERAKMIKECYQPTEVEKTLYIQAISFLKPEFSEPRYIRDCDKEQQREMVKLLEDLINWHSTLVYYSHYQETLLLIKQMMQEDSERKHTIRGVGGILPPGILDKDGKQANLSLDEEIDLYIYYLRYNYFDKDNRYNKGNNYKMSFQSRLAALKPSNFSAHRIAFIGEPAVPKMMGLLEDRRPIIVVDDTKIPAVFYRYQDAAVEILEGMFVPDKIPHYKPQFIASRLFPVQLPEDQYFSEYMEKQTPEGRQKVINDIKVWVEEALNNPVEPEEPTQPKEEVNPEEPPTEPEEEKPEEPTPQSPENK
ncbi:MAG: hypothetical protein QME51_07260 [Planctomycetota bacterium]|nr:hypothetical protein [Planctomycetota bacterium]MDI6788152.1 hypothetical protein [Planctomycetota bacterium]